MVMVLEFIILFINSAIYKTRIFVLFSSAGELKAVTYEFCADEMSGVVDNEKFVLYIE